MEGISGRSRATTTTALRAPSTELQSGAATATKTNARLQREECAILEALPTDKNSDSRSLRPPLVRGRGKPTRENDEPSPARRAHEAQSSAARARAGGVGKPPGAAAAEATRRRPGSCVRGSPARAESLE